MSGSRAQKHRATLVVERKEKAADGVALLEQLAGYGDKLHCYREDRTGHIPLDSMDPARIPAAVEEALRLRPPFFGFFRRTTEDTGVAGVDIPAGGDVYMSWAAANRDPKMFENPERFRLDRRRNRHLSFGFGVHTCPGAPLARMELRVLIEELFRRLPDLRVDVDELEYRFGGGDYSFPVALPVSFTPGSPEGGSS
jgi:cytochrome P450